ncbi:MULTISPECIES: sulfurtransferase-like selenium metabolism protein YedF [Pseudomonas]|uniref:TusA-related sulfurtransferase n=1 Tax=Pseudomonas lutea TaxID=243924 RepID=A0A9X8MCB1_9PSED|nr:MULTISPECIES: sulfurtransferase-like selenium metabolism protein YedF [Pseudomonas]AYN93653.1 putative sulfurtransferase YedF [Pseudomonas sp. LTJR-52]MBA1247335.1 sulfurtransferase-like selenium metabolism protein YedF [Pseudomonas zeshuii]QEU28050.1 sulfurtransferase-like selenium metabolism protein YedF [Pseudomonas luteola]RRW46790.1 putative sulfurtransferase YedF [Pseudomonas luteola]SEQ42592.1 TusA-related sulfurtransferase [Pseudomonas lutea]
MSTQPDLSLDLRGEHCPYNAIATLETLETMQAGQLLEVITDCAQSVHGIPEDTQRYGYLCRSVEQHGSLFRFLIEVPAEKAGQTAASVTV